MNGFQIRRMTIPCIELSKRGKKRRAVEKTGEKCKWKRKEMGEREVKIRPKGTENLAVQHALMVKKYIEDPRAFNPTRKISRNHAANYFMRSRILVRKNMYE